MVINGIIDLDNGELLEATGKHRISALDIQGSETAELKLTFYKNGSAVTDNSVVSGAVIDFGVKADADYTGTSYLIYHDNFSASTDGLTYSGTPTWATAEVETALGNESSVKLHGQVKVVISGVTYYSQVLEVEIHNNVIQAAGTTNSVIYPRLIQSTSDPTVNDDSLDGYGVSSLWLNTSSNAVHVLMDNTAGAAVWAGFLGLTNGELANNLVFNDDLKAVFGTSSDGLEIYHSSDENYIDDSGTGRLFIRSNGSGVFLQKTDGDNLAKFKTDGATELYYSGSKKIESTNLGATVTGKLIVSGDLDVDGTTTTFNSTVVTVDDPVFGIGGDTAPGSQDNKDRGVSFRYHDGASAKVGFYGWDNSENAFTFLTDTNDDSTEVFSGTLGNLKVGNVLHGDGSDSSPSLTFSSDTNTGFYKYGNDQIGIATNGTFRAKFSSTGIFEHWTGITLRGGVFKNQNGSDSAPSYTFYNDTDTGIFRPTANNLAFTTGGTEAARFDSSGRLITPNNVGIGTVTDPSYPLVIRKPGDGVKLDITDGVDANFRVAVNGAVTEIGPSTATAAFMAGGAERMRLNSTGLGIGGTPSVKLHVKDGSSGFSGSFNSRTQAIIESDNSSGTALSILNPSSGNGAIYFGDNSEEYSGQIGYFHTGDIMKFATGATVRMSLNSTGLGIGGAPSEKLTIDSGNIQLTNGNYIIFDGPTPKQTKMRSYYDGETHLAMTVANSSVLDLTSSLINVPDSIELAFGANNDLKISHDGTNSGITNYFGDFYISNFANDKDIIFRSDDGSGGYETYFYLDGSASSGNPITKFPDNSRLVFGSAGAGDMALYHDGTNSYINTYTGDLIIRANANDKDIIFQSDNGSGGTETYLYLDGSQSSGNPVTVIPDNAYLSIGNNLDFNLRHNGTNSLLINNTGDLKISQFADDKDVIFSTSPSGVSTEILRLDGSTGNVGIGGGGTSPSHLLSLGSSGNDSGKKLSLFLGNTGTYSAIGAQRGESNLFCSSEIRFINEDNSSGTGAISLATGTNSLSERMRINSSGNCGISTSAPSCLLNLNDANNNLSHQLGFSYESGGSKVDAFTIGRNNSTGNLEFHSDINNHGFEFKHNGAGTQEFNILNMKCGIGTDAPSTLTHLKSDTKTVLTIESDSDNNDEGDEAAIHFLTDGGLNTAAITGGNATNEDSASNFNCLNLQSKLIRFHTGAAQNFESTTERMRLDESGNLCLGNTSASAKLDIRQDSGIALRCEDGTGAYFTVDQNGNLLLKGSSPVMTVNSTNATSGFRINVTGLDADNDLLFRVQDNGTNRFKINRNGDVGINGDPSANADLTLGNGELCMAETTTPTADANFGKIYCKSDNKLYFQDGAGTEHEIAFV